MNFRKSVSNEKGMALVTAMAAALILSLTAVVVLNMTSRRFELSAFRTDRAVAGLEAEVGLQYAFARLADPAFQTTVQAKISGGVQQFYVITSDPDLSPKDLLVPQLQVGKKVGPAGTYVGGKHVTVRIKFNPTGAGGASRPYEVRASTSFGTGA